MSTYNEWHHRAQFILLPRVSDWIWADFLRFVYTSSTAPIAHIFCHATSKAGEKTKEQMDKVYLLMLWEPPSQFLVLHFSEGKGNCFFWDKQPLICSSGLQAVTFPLQQLVRVGMDVPFWGQTQSESQTPLSLAFLPCPFCTSFNTHWQPSGPTQTELPCSGQTNFFWGACCSNVYMGIHPNTIATCSAEVKHFESFQPHVHLEFMKKHAHP